MAHNLATIKSRVAMAYSEADPWHSLGHRIPASTTSRQAIHEYLAYQVSLVPTFALLNGQYVPLSDYRQAVVRDGDTVIGTVGPGYHEAQNHEALGIAEILEGEGGMTVASIGALGLGETAWLLMRNHKQIPLGGSVIHTYLCLSTGHTGETQQRGIKARGTGTYVVCQNTFNMVRGNAVISIRHTASVQARIAEAKRVLAAFGKAQEQAGQNYQKMLATPLTVDQLVDYWATVFPAPKKQEPYDPTVAIVRDLLNAKDERNTAEERREVVAWLLNNGKTKHFGQTAMGVYSAVTEYVDHIYLNRQDGTPRKNGAQSALFGGGAIIRDRAWEAALALTK